MSENYNYKRQGILNTKTNENIINNKILYNYIIRIGELLIDSNYKAINKNAIEDNYKIINNNVIDCNYKIVNNTIQNFINYVVQFSKVPSAEKNLAEAAPQKVQILSLSDVFLLPTERSQPIQYSIKLCCLPDESCLGREFFEELSARLSGDTTIEFSA